MGARDVPIHVLAFDFHVFSMIEYFGGRCLSKYVWRTPSLAPVLPANPLPRYAADLACVEHDLIVQK
jgi:hypothetical protein